MIKWSNPQALSVLNSSCSSAHWELSVHGHSLSPWHIPNQMSHHQHSSSCHICRQPGHEQTKRMTWTTNSWECHWNSGHFSLAQSKYMQDFIPQTLREVQSSIFQFVYLVTIVWIVFPLFWSWQTVHNLHLIEKSYCVDRLNIKCSPMEKPHQLPSNQTLEWK